MSFIFQIRYKVATDIISGDTRINYNTITIPLHFQQLLIIEPMLI